MPDEEQIATNLRLPVAMHQQLREMAHREHRSLNGQILWLLQHVMEEVEA